MAASVVELVDLGESLQCEPTQAACVEEPVEEARLGRESGEAGSQEITETLRSQGEWC